MNRQINDLHADISKILQIGKKYKLDENKIPSYRRAN